MGVSKLKENPAAYQFSSIRDCLFHFGKTYDTTALLNDYIHLLHFHHDDKSFEAVFNFLKHSDCDIVSCPNMERNNRNRATNDAIVTISDLYGASEPREVNIQQILDQMHCYWFHSFELGYRLTAREQEETLQLDEEKTEESLNEEVEASSLQNTDKLLEDNNQRHKPNVIPLPEMKRNEEEEDD